VPPGKQEPKPVQQPGPPVLLGGTARPALERAGRIADGWVTSSRTDLAKISESVSVVQEAAAAAGRGPIRIICRGVVRAGRDGTALLSGSYQKIREDTAWLGTQGVTEVFYDLNWDPRVGNPDVAPDAAAGRAAEVMEALAPYSGSPFGPELP
jgi:alkanesulfonate monooxygenase SsuD/methylene tetrahydromethanopterin reductase-like flavin-dependent oxidoreductase (luciferase family)